LAIIREEPPLTAIGALLNFKVRCLGGSQRSKAEPGQAATLR
jgi:hypothetical protein